MVVFTTGQLVQIAENSLSFLGGASRMADSVRRHDWAAHPMGTPDGWPAALRMTLNLVLNSSFPMFVAWSDQRFLFFNDAYLPTLGRKAGQALGRPLHEVWSEVWDAIGPIVRRAEAGEPVFFENLAVTLERNGYPEQTWFTFSYGPVLDEAGAVRGVMGTLMEVTEKVTALVRQREAQDRLNLSLEASGNIGTWTVDLATGATYVDERFARLFHIDPALARSGTALHRFTDRIHPDDRAAVVAAIDHAIGHDTLYDIEYRLPQHDGRDVWVNARGKVFADPVTGARRFAGVAVDITERKAAMLARAHSEQVALDASRAAQEQSRRLGALLDAAPVGIVYTDPAGRMLTANAANHDIWGSHPTSASKDEYGEWKGWWPAGSARAGRAVGIDEWPMSRVLAGEESVTEIVEIEPFGAPGVRKTILVRTAAMRDEDGRLVGAVGANMDITAQRAAERAARESEARFGSMASLIPQLIWSAGADGVNRYLNERWTEYTGLPLTQLEGNGWKSIIHADDLAGLLTRWEETRWHGDAFEIEHRLRHRSGEFRWVLNRAQPYLTQSGERHWIGTLTDVHDQRSGVDELKAAARRKDEFLAMLAHELRNPLAPISHAAQLLALSGHDEQRVRQSSDVIVRQVRHMTSLVDDLLDVSRVTRGLVELRLEPLDIESVVASAMEQVRPLVESRRHVMELLARPSQGWRASRVRGDRTRLVQIVANLLNNAAKYTPQGGRIALSVEVGEGLAHITVSDNGAGIGPDLLPHVFEIFTQAERTPDRAQGGLGLGLALVKSLTALHGGSVRAHSDGLGKGSSFVLTLPTIAAAGPSAGRRISPGQGARRDARRILIVDDNVDAVESLAEILRSLGHDVATATSGREALSRVAAGRPDVFILDIGLPDLHGHELVRRLHAGDGGARGGKALYIALTGYGQAHDRVLSKSAGFDHHLVKPVDLDLLLELVSGAQ